MRSLLFAASLVAIATTSIAFAQYPPTSPYPTYNYQGRASTVGESHARGMSDLITAAGQANVANSQAAQGWQQARSMEYDNHRKGTETYFETREMNKKYRAQAAGPKPTAEQLFRLAKQGAPQQLSPSELDPLTGAIQWPSALRGDAFKPYRERLDKLYAARAHGTLNGQQFSQVRQLTSDMKGVLRQQIRNIPPSQYGSSKRFIESLNHEFQRPVG